MRARDPEVGATMATFPEETLDAFDEACMATRSFWVRGTSRDVAARVAWLRITIAPRTPAVPTVATIAPTALLRSM